jgi:hypothetical protein
MNVPDVVHAFRRMTELRAVPSSPIQFWLGANPNSEKIGLTPIAPRTALKKPSGAARKIQRVVIAAELAMAGK